MTPAPQSTNLCCPRLRACRGRPEILLFRTHRKPGNNSPNCLFTPPPELRMRLTTSRHRLAIPDLLSLSKTSYSTINNAMTVHATVQLSFMATLSVSECNCSFCFCPLSVQGLRILTLIVPAMLFSETKIKYPPPPAPESFQPSALDR